MLIRKSEKVEGTCHFVDDVKHGAARTFRLSLGDCVGYGIMCVERVRLRLHRVFAEFHASAQHGGDGVGKRGEQLIAAFMQDQRMEFHVEIMELRKSGFAFLVGFGDLPHFRRIHGEFRLDVDGGKTCGGSRCSRFDR